MADVTIHMDYSGWISRIDVYANAVLIAYLDQDRDDDDETRGWRAENWYGPMRNPALTLSAVRERLNGCTMAEWEAALQEWAASLTDAEWEATVKTLHTEQIERAIRTVASDIGRYMEHIGALKPMNAAASDALVTLAQVQQRLHEETRAIGVPYPLPATGWTLE